MSADNWILLNTDTFEVSYGQGEAVCETWECKSLEEAVKVAGEIDDEKQTEYGVTFIHSKKRVKKTK